MKRNNTKQLSCDLMFRIVFIFLIDCNNTQEIKADKNLIWQQDGKSRDDNG